jgi:hypothetical protein
MKGSEVVTSVRQIQRPGVVTFVVILLWIQAISAAVAGIAAIVFRDNATVQDTVNQASGDLVVYGIIELAVGALVALVAVSLRGGSRGARNLVGVVQAIRVGVAVWAIVTHHAGGFLGTSIVTIALGTFILWALYGNERSDEFFEAA